MSEVLKLSALSVLNAVSKVATLLGLSNGTLSVLNSKAVFVKRPEVTDLDDAVATGYYAIKAQVTANIPDGVKYGILLVFEDDTSAEKEFVQIIFSISTPPAMYTRKKGTSSGWSSWYKFSGVEIPKSSGV